MQNRRETTGPGSLEQRRPTSARDRRETTAGDREGSGNQRGPPGSGGNNKFDPMNRASMQFQPGSGANTLAKFKSGGAGGAGVRESKIGLPGHGQKSQQKLKSPDEQTGPVGGSGGISSAGAGVGANGAGANSKLGARSVSNQNIRDPVANMRKSLAAKRAQSPGAPLVAASKKANEPRSGAGASRPGTPGDRSLTPRGDGRRTTMAPGGGPSGLSRSGAHGTLNGAEVTKGRATMAPGGAGGVGALASRIK